MQLGCQTGKRSKGGDSRPPTIPNTTRCVEKQKTLHRTAIGRFLSETRFWQTCNNSQCRTRLDPDKCDQANEVRMCNHCFVQMSQESVDNI